MNKNIVVASLAAMLLSACGGGGAEVKTTTTAVSVGQQLIDLKKARDTGSMTQPEYERAKASLIERTLEN